MLNFFVKCLVVASWIVALVLSALTVEERSSWAPLISDAVVEVTAWSGEQRVTDLRRDLTDLANAADVAIGQIEPDVRDNRGARIIYLAGAGADQIIADPPRLDFGSTMKTSFAPMREIEHQDPVGHWVVLGQHDEVSTLAEALRAQGATAEIKQNNRWPTLEWPGSLNTAVGLVLSTAAAALVISRTRRLAISRLHGGSFPEAAVHVLGPMVAVWIASGAVLLLLGGGWLFAAQGSIGLWEWVAHSACVGAVFLAFVVVGAGSTLGVVWTTSLVRALKGELPARGVIIASWAMRIGAGVLALGAIGQCLSLATAAANRERSLEAMKTIPGAHLLFIGGALYSNEDQTKMGKIMAPWMQRQAESGRLMLANPQESPVGQLLYVNHRYLSSNKLLLQDGRDVRDVVKDDEVAVLIPEERWEDRDSILLDTRASVEIDAGMGSDFPMATFMAPRRQKIPLFGIPDETAGWSNGMGERETTWLEDPIILVVLDGKFNGYISATTQGRVLFFEVEALIQEAAADPVLGGYVASFTPVEVRAARYAAEALIIFRLRLFEAGIAMMIAVVAGVSLAVSYSKLRGQRIFVRHLHGRSAFGSYAAVLTAEAVLALGVLLWLPWQVLRQRAEFEAVVEATGALGHGAPPTIQLADLLPGVLVVLVVSGGMAVTLWWVHRRIVSKGVSEA